jgi:hypothetical protein
MREPELSHISGMDKRRVIVASRWTSRPRRSVWFAARPSGDRGLRRGCQLKPGPFRRGRAPPEPGDAKDRWPPRLPDERRLPAPHKAVFRCVAASRTEPAVAPFPCASPVAMSATASSYASSGGAGEGPHVIHEGRGDVKGAVDVFDFRSGGWLRLGIVPWSIGGLGRCPGLAAWLPGELVWQEVVVWLVMVLWGWGAASLTALRLGRRLQSSIRSRGADQGVVRCSGAQSSERPSCSRWARRPDIGASSPEHARRALVVNASLVWAGVGHAASARSWLSSAVSGWCLMQRISPSRSP